MRVRAYASADAAPTLDVFLNAVQVTAAGDYSPEQIAAWARPGNRNIGEWNQRRTASETIVAVVGDQIAGFSDLDADGLIDMMFVAPAWGRRGVASALMEENLARAEQRGIKRLHADVSITARTFFERSGFVAVREQHPVVDGVLMTNFRMERVLQA